MSHLIRRISLILLIFLSSTILFSESSGELIKSLYSPLFLGGGTSVTRMDTPEAISLNPASAGNFQRMILDAGYINLQKWDGSMQGMGHAVNTAVSYPSKYGVFSGALRFASTSGLDSPEMDFGEFFQTDIAFSKEIYKNLYAGFGVTGALGTDLEWGSSLNLGVIHHAGTLGKLKNFQWGGSLSGLGYNYGSSAGFDRAIPENLTLNGGAAFDLIRKDDFQWTMSADAGFPTFSDLRFEIGQEIVIQEKIRIALSSSMILSELIDGNYQTLLPSAGLYYNYTFKGKDSKKTEKQTSEIEIQGAYAPMYDDIHAVGLGATIPFGVRDTNAPEISVEQDEKVYISPDLNGVQDEIDIPFGVEDERYVMGYHMAVRNEEGLVVKEFKNKDERPENESFKNIFDRMFAEKKGTAIPDSFRWDGVMDSGEVAPDGEYSYSLQFWDDNDNISETGSFEFVIDTVQPEIALEKSEGIDLIFSPDGDGNKDILTIEQSGSSELYWEGQVLDLGGSPVRTYTWEKGAPQTFAWDGKDDTGSIVPDGVYSYVVRSTDKAGNRNEENLVDILVNTEKPPVNLTIDNSYLSPGNPEGTDIIHFGTGIPVTSGILEWELQVKDSRGNIAWRYNSRQEGVLEVPEEIPYAGDNPLGGFITEGRYQGFMTVRYQNGYQPEVFSPWFTVDTTAPRGTIEGENILTLNDEGNQYSLELTLNTTEEDYWEGFIRDSSNETVKSFFWRGKADPVIVWNGNDNEGKPVADGSYTMVLEAVDKAGNRGVSAPHRINLDTREMSVQISVSDEAFSPDRNGVKDSVSFYQVIDDPENITEWSLSVSPVDADGITGDPVRSWSGESSPPSELKWDGLTNGGTPASDGYYIAEIDALYAKGNRPGAKTGLFLKDTVAPEISVSLPYGLFSPDGDGNRDIVRIVQTSSSEEGFEAVLMDSRGQIVNSWFWKDQVENVVWDGTDENGNILPDGSYSYAVSSTDRAGNSKELTLTGIQIDTKSTPVYLTAKNTLFSPVSETIPEQVFTAHVTNTEGIESWRLAIIDENGTAVKEDAGTGTVPSSLLWDGRNSSGVMVEGVFKGQLTVNYTKGNRPVADSREFTVDNSAPLVEIGLDPQPFSPDDDNIDDELKISMAVKDLSPIRDWQMVIQDPKGKEFISFGGNGRPSERIIWDGRSRQGELVQSAEDYPYELRITDLLGNSTTRTGLIPVDILVIRDGENLKVQISNITFQPYQAVLVTAGDQGQKNRDVLQRLSEVLKKYGSYKIVVEGHAVSEYYDNPSRAAREEKEELQPLSLSRAAAVRDALSDLGIQNSRMDVVGRGGTMPIVPHSDLDNRWKNRRVEFILIK